MPRGIPQNGINKGHFKKGHVGYKALLGKVRTEEHSRKISESHKGIKLPETQKIKISQSLKGIQRSKESYEKISGKKSYLWKGGITPIHEKIRKSAEYKLWRISVFERDDYTCMWCKKRGGELQADHIKPFAFYPKLRFIIDNGRTLCVSCHRKTNTYGRQSKKLLISN